MALVQIFLRGGCDTLSLVAPIDGADRKVYEEARPNLKIPVQGERKALPVSATLGLHPSAKALHAMYQAKRLAIVQATGLMKPTRSHFDAQAFIETGGAAGSGPRDGWLGRLMNAGFDAPFAGAKSAHPQALSAMALNPQLATSLVGYDHAVALNAIGEFNVAGGTFQDQQRSALRRMYGAGRGGWLERGAIETLDVIDELEGLAKPDEKGPEYPKGDVAGRLKTLAQLLKLGVGISVVSIDMGGWDTHKQQGGAGEGAFANMVGQLSDALDAFFKDLESSKASAVLGRLRVVVMTEFGRRVKENGNGGTDHGHGSFMLVLGAGVNGGKVYGQWPGLKTEQLFERADLNVTTDYRQVLSEVALGEKLASHAGVLFPGFNAQKPLGLIKA